MSIFDSFTETLKPRREARSAVISYRTTPELKKALKGFAKSQGMNMQDLVSDALLMYLKNKEAEMEAEQEKENIHNA